MRRRELTYSQLKPRRARKKPGVTAKARAKRRRAEDPVKKRVRGECVERDGYCVVWGQRPFRDVGGAAVYFVSDCFGPSEWAHMHSKRRAQTRNQAPEVRRDTAHSFMACQRHHDQYDGRQRPRLFVTALSSKGADGPLKFRLGK